MISVSPSFEMYSVYNNMYGMIYCPLSYNENFEIKFEDILNLIDSEASIITMLNPNSPIGQPWNEDEIIRIIEKAKENNALVIIDEAYHHFYPVNCFAIKFAQMLLEDTEIKNYLVRKEKEGREYLLLKLKENNYKYYYSGGIYILIKSNREPCEIFTLLK